MATPHGDQQNPPTLPKGPDWTALTLEETWPDRLDLSHWSGWRELLHAIFSRERRRVQLPNSLPGRELIPKYALQEFHNIPNGNYSKRFSRGYITGFDVMMVGHMAFARNWITERLNGCQTVVDVGTGGGRTAAAIKLAGVPYVCGVDPSPYLLQHAAVAHPGIEFILGTAEQLPIEDCQLNGVAACFVLHEIPPYYIANALREIFRVLQPGGRLALVEPSATQMKKPPWRSLLQRTGWRHLYFAVLAQIVHEPFIRAWHNVDKATLFAEAGFALAEEYQELPFHCWLLEKPA